MINYIIKLDGISLTDIKNVRKGYLKIRNNEAPDIVGIYGQNGTGKTAVIDCMEAIQTLLTGRALDRHFFDYLYAGAKESEIAAVFYIKTGETVYTAEYGVRLKPAGGDSFGFIISSEYLSVEALDGDGVKCVCDFEDGDSVLSPEWLFEELTANDKKRRRVLDTQKIIAAERRKSFLFDGAVCDMFFKNGKSPLAVALNILRTYANMDLFVIKNSHSGIISLCELIPLSFKIGEGSGRVVKGEAEIKLDQPTLYPMAGYKDVLTLIGQLNVVLRTIVPDLQIFVKEYGEQAGDMGQACMKFELLASSSGALLPLRNESEGIKKIISILSALISFYNRENTTVLVDELDAGIFEYLLGELLSVLKENGKGQLIFTSHNQRPIEILDKECVYFTTCNPSNRYIKLKNVGTGENFRDFYYRTIALGGQKEKLYDGTNLSELSIALRIAGKE